MSFCAHQASSIVSIVGRKLRMIDTPYTWKTNYGWLDSHYGTDVVCGIHNIDLLWHERDKEQSARNVERRESWQTRYRIQGVADLRLADPFGSPKRKGGAGDE